MRHYPKDDLDSRIRHYPEDGPDFCGEEESEEESLFQKQAWFVIGIACLLCAGMILYSMFFTDPWVGGEGAPPEVSSLASGVSVVSPEEEKLDLNTATLEELEALPAIGPVRARAILQYREESGPFYTVEQVVEVEGIGEETLEEIRPYTRVETEGLPSPKAQEKVDLNTATLEELDTLPGIGPARAQAILQYREESGPFYTVEQVVEVEGIGEKTLEKIRPYAIVKEESSLPPV